MQRVFLICALLLAMLGPAQAQRFDSTWRRISPEALTDLELSGGDVRLNNLIVAPERDDQARGKPDQLTTYIFSVSGIKRVAGPRSAFLQIVGMTAQQTPTISSIIALNFSDTEVNRLRTDTHRFPALPREVSATTDYFVRVLVQ
jgi:hypothetical protein